MGMGANDKLSTVRELKLLEAIEDDPDIRQADLATRLGAAVGTINWLIKRLVSKGYVKVKRIGRWQWRYILTPQGFAAKARLTQQYLHSSLQLYRETRKEAGELVREVEESGYDRVCLVGDPGSELMDIVSLTCLEQGLEQVTSTDGALPRICVTGSKLILSWPVLQRNEEGR